MNQQATRNLDPLLKSINKQQFVGVILLILLVISMIVGIYLSSQQTKYQPEAASGNGSLSFSPPNDIRNVGDSGTIRIVVNPGGESINSGEVTFTYDDNVITITDVRPGSFFTSKTAEFGEPLTLFESNLDGFYSYGVGFALRTSPDAPINASSSPGDFVEIDYILNKTGETTLQLITDGSPTTKLNNVDGMNVLGSVSSGQISSSSTSSNARIYLERVGNRNITVGDTITYDIFFDTANKNVVGVDALIDLNSSHFGDVNVKGNVETFTSFPQEEYNSGSNLLILTGSGANKNLVVNGDKISLGRFSLTALQPGTDIPINLRYENGSLNDSNMVALINTGTEPVDILAGVQNTTVTIFPKSDTPPASTNPTEDSNLTISTINVLSPSDNSVIATEVNGTITIDRNTYPEIRIAAIRSNADVDSISFLLDGKETVTNNPFTLDWSPEEGTYTLTVKGYDDPNAEGNFGTERTSTLIITAENNPQPSDTGDIRLRLSHQGKRRANISRSMDVSLALYTPTGQFVESFLNKTTDTDGYITLSEVPTGNYKIAVDSPGYLTRFYGDSSNTFTVTKNSSLFADLSEFPLLGGDFNGDNVVNEIDFSLYYISNFRNNNPLVDLDRSGEVNNLDFSIMRSNWGFESDIIIPPENI